MLKIPLLGHRVIFENTFRSRAQVMRDRVCAYLIQQMKQMPDQSSGWVKSQERQSRFWVRVRTGPSLITCIYTLRITYTVLSSFLIQTLNATNWECL